MAFIGFHMTSCIIYILLVNSCASILQFQPKCSKNVKNTFNNKSKIDEKGQQKEPEKVSV